MIAVNDSRIKLPACCHHKKVPVAKGCNWDSGIYRISSVGRRHRRHLGRRGHSLARHHPGFPVWVALH